MGKRILEAVLIGTTATTLISLFNKLIERHYKEIDEKKKKKQEKKEVAIKSCLRKE
jgi:hypothetical protein